MAYPAKLLGPDEHVARELRPHWRILIVPLLLLLATVAVASFLAALVWTTGGSEAWRDWIGWTIVGIAAVVLLVWCVVPFLRWTTTEYVFTNRRIIVRSGLLTRTGRDMPLSTVNNVSFQKTLVDRILDAGTLVVESASGSGGLTIAHVKDVESVQREVYHLHEEDDAWRRADRDGDPWNGAATTS